MEKYILITAVVIMIIIIILALDFILSKDGYHAIHVRNVFIKRI